MQNQLVKNPFIVTILLIAIFWVHPTVLAQTLNKTNRNKKNNRRTSTLYENWDVSTNLGITQFYGDVSSHGFFKKFNGESSFSPDIRIRKMFNPYWGVGLSLFYTGLSSIKDIKADGTVVNYSLSGNYYDVNLFLYVNLSNLLFAYKSTRKWNFFGTVGFGYGMWNSMLTDNITGISIKSGTPNGTTTFATSGVVVPIGLGLNYRLSKHWGVQLGGEFRTVLNDDVDVWHDGFQYDQLFTTKVGVTYFIKPGWTLGNLKRPDKKKKDECCEEDLYRKKKTIPVFDYTYNPPAKNTTTPPKTVEVMHINKPVNKRNNIYPGNHFRDFEFRVQILAKTTKLPHPENLQAEYKLDYPVLENYQDGLYRYSTGSFDKYQDALAHSKIIRRHGIFDAFVVAYSHGKRIKLTKAMKNTIGRYQPSDMKQNTYRSNVIY